MIYKKNLMKVVWQFVSLNINNIQTPGNSLLVIAVYRWPHELTLASFNDQYR